MSSSTNMGTGHEQKEDRNPGKMPEQHKAHPSEQVGGAAAQACMLTSSRIRAKFLGPLRSVTTLRSFRLAPAFLRPLPFLPPTSAARHASRRKAAHKLQLAQHLDRAAVRPSKCASKAGDPYPMPALAKAQPTEYGRGPLAAGRSMVRLHNAPRAGCGCPAHRCSPTIVLVLVFQVELIVVTCKAERIHSLLVVVLQRIQPGLCGLSRAATAVSATSHREGGEPVLSLHGSMYIV
jgi:hypothetical protein